VIRHPLVRRHPYTGRKALYAVSGTSFAIEGMPDDEALALLRDRPTPLALYVFTGDRATETRVLAETRSGGACVNDVISHTIGTGLPFGGLGESGLGAYHGRAGFESFSHQRAVLRRATWPDTPFRYQPEKLSLRGLMRAMRFLLRW